MSENKVENKAPTSAPVPVAKAQNGMPLANLRLKLNKYLDVVLSEVTPAELLLLVAMHHGHAGGNPVVQDSLKEIGSVERTNQEELARLRGKYAASRVAKIYVGAKPELPKTFKEAQELGVNLTIRGENLV
jgi:hypothetical protein